MEWQLIETNMPAPHNCYHVWRKDLGFFHATPCYGMHSPWWVPRNGVTKEESDPIPMVDTWWKSPLEPPA